MNDDRLRKEAVVAYSMYYGEDLRGWTEKTRGSSWEVNGTSTCQDITGILWKTQAYFSIQNGPPLVATQSHMNVTHSHPIPYRSSLILSSNLLSCLSLLCLLMEISYAFLVAPKCATCLTHLIPFHLITVIIFGNNFEARHYVIF
jgi:hypothetical protein